MPRPLESKLKALFQVRNTLICSDSIKDLTEKALELAQEKLHSQTASVFLFSKRGLLERVAIHGTDKDGVAIPGNWYADEAHRAGESFTGKVVAPVPGSDFGEPHWSNELDEEDVDSGSREAYREKLGLLRCAIAIPLNGRHRTYGALEVINKVDRQGRVDPNLGFASEDVSWLSDIGISLAGAISDLRRRNELEVLFEIIRLLVEPFKRTFDAGWTYGQVARKLVGPLANYSACIIRLAEPSDILKVVAYAGDGLSSEQGIAESVRKGEGIAGKVFSSGKRIVLGDLKEESCIDPNQVWVYANGLRSAACFPLSAGSLPVGTLTVFTGYVHTYHDSDVAFLQSVAALVATISESCRIVGELRAVNVDDEEHLSEMRGVSYDLTVHSLLHDQKHQFERIIGDLTDAISKSPSYRLNAMNRLVGELAGEVNKIERRMRDESGEISKEAVDIDEVIRSQVKHFRMQLSDSEIPIGISASPGKVPVVLAREEEVKDIVFNLISNAVKAIQQAHRRQGVITVATRIVELEIAYIEITVEDNGVGIRNENRDKVFHRGYTTFEKGTGQGLFVAQKIVRSYGGTIDFDSVVGKGTKFFVRIPKRIEL